MEEILSKKRWILACEIVRFMKCIDDSDFENSPESPLYYKLISRGNKQVCILSADSASEEYGLLFNSSNGSGGFVFISAKFLKMKSFVKSLFRQYLSLRL